VGSVRKGKLPVNARVAGDGAERLGSTTANTGVWRGENTNGEAGHTADAEKDGRCRKG